MSCYLKRPLIFGFIGIASLLLMAGCASKQAENGQPVSLIDEEIDAPDAMKTGPGLQNF